MKYVRGRYFKERRKNPTPNEKVGNKQQENSMVQHAVDEIILQEIEKENFSVKNETHEKIDDEVEKYQLYDPDKLSLDEKK